MLCGLNNQKTIIPLLQHYVDRTGDVQTAAFLALLPEVKIPRSSAPDSWIRAFRELLNSWKLWEIRAKLDIAIEPFWQLEEPSKVFPNYKMSQPSRYDAPQHPISVPNCCVCLLPLDFLPGSSNTSFASTSSSSSLTHPSSGDRNQARYSAMNSPIQHFSPQSGSSGSRMPHMSSAAAAMTAEQANILARKAESDSRHTHGGVPPNSGAPFRRSGNSSSLGGRQLGSGPTSSSSSPSSSLSSSSSSSSSSIGGGGSSSASGGDAGTNLPGSEFAQWWSWCQSCKHVAHTTHIREWFAHNDECPVTDCHCHCYSKDKL